MAFENIIVLSTDRNVIRLEHNVGAIRVVEVGIDNDDKLTAKRIEQFAHTNWVLKHIRFSREPLLVNRVLDIQPNSITRNLEPIHTVA